MRIALVALSVLFLAVPLAESSTWQIREDGSGDAPTVQAGIDSAAVGDTVLVHPGTYNEAIDFLGKDILVLGAVGAEATILDATGLGIKTVVTLQTGETQAAQLQGFTVTGGEQGILIQDSAPTIYRNIVTGNVGARSGAGIWCVATTTGSQTWSPIIKENIVTKNVAENISSGIGQWRKMKAEIIDNYIAENRALEGDGGGIYYRGWGSGGIVRGNVIVDNYAGDHGGGVYAGSGLYGTIFEFELSWNLIANNTADGLSITYDSAGGVWLWETSAWVHHNTIVRNAGHGSPPRGGGIVLGRPGSPILEKNIIALTIEGGGIYCTEDPTPTIRNNLGWENIGGEGVGPCADWWQSDGNVVDDPAFCDPDNGNYAVAQNSPAMTHPAGPLGALHLPGCGPVAVVPTTWGRIKSLYVSQP